MQSRDRLTENLPTEVTRMLNATTGVVCEEFPFREDEDDKLSKLSCTEKLTYFLKNITIEPFLFMYIVGIMISNMVVRNLYLEKACRVNLGYSDEVCNAMMSSKEDNQNVYEIEAQRILVQAVSWKIYISATVPCIIQLLAGSFSDKTGYRKVFLIVTLVGSMLIAINALLQVWFFHQLRLEYLVFSEVILESITGGTGLAALVAFAYISAITTHKNRTYRIGIISVCVNLAMPIGAGVSGTLQNKLGYYGCFGLVLGLYIISLLYIILVVPEQVPTLDQKMNQDQGACYLIKTCFNFTLFKEIFVLMFKKAPNNRRLKLCLMVIPIALLYGPIPGEIAVMYVSTRYKFNWNEVQYSIFLAFNLVTSAIGTFFSISVLTTRLKWHDSLLALLAILSKVSSAFVYCFAQNENIFYIAPLVEMFSGVAQVALRSLMSKIVDPGEVGKASAVVSLVENVIPLVYVPLYTNVYTATMETLPGAAFLVGSLLTVLAVPVLCYLYYDHRKGLPKKLLSSAED